MLEIEIGLLNEWSGTTATTSQVKPPTEETKLNRQAAPQSVCVGWISPLTQKKKNNKKKEVYSISRCLSHMRREKENEEKKKKKQTLCVRR
jgi:hypothetical protein